ncbi:MAG: NADH-quinone oxidoreductase subunit A [Fibrobacteres bacterium]|nr:NADH-quinone oxidoreductase subunit A [Fibrobacterota bacterium]
MPAGQSNFAEYGSIAVVFLLTITVVFTLMTLVRIITRVFSRIQTIPGKFSTYECGETPVGPAWFRFNNRFYLVAILFLVFDVEVALMFPILAHYTTFIRDGVGGAALLKIAVFAGTLALGLVYAAKKGDLAWNKSVRLDQGDQS